MDVENVLMMCGTVVGMDAPIAASVLLAGLLGSVTHCSVMCSPMVVAQMLELRHTGQSTSPILYYHLGRITTYAMLGFTACMMGQWAFGAGLHRLSHSIILLAGMVFCFSAIMPRKTHQCCKGKWQQFTAMLYRIPSPVIMHFLRGLFMGFMPCGMVIAVLLLVSTSKEAWQAAGLMLLFGIATLPALQVVGLTALKMNQYFTISPHVPVGRIIMATQGLLLCAIGSGLVQII